MSTKYQMWFNYDNDAKQYCIPVLPEKIKLSTKGELTSATIDKFGEVFHKGKRDAIEVSFSSFFPAKWSSLYCSCTKKNFKKPAKWVKWMRSLQNAAKPAHVVLTGSPVKIDMYADITTFTAEEEGGDVGTVYYTVSFKEHRDPTIREYKKTSTSKPKVVTTTKEKRVNNKETAKTHTVVYGDCLWNLAKKYYGDATQYTKIYNANKDLMDAEARKHGFSSSDGGNRIWPGMKLTIP